MDFVVRLPRTTRGLDSIWVIVDRLTKSAHFIPVHTSYSAERLARIYIREVDELGTRVDLSTAFHPQTDGQSERMIQLPLEYSDGPIRGLIWLRTAQSRHQSYADRRRRPLKFAVGDRVFLRVSPMKGVMRFWRRGKLSPRYIGLFEILRIVGEVAYELALPPAFLAIHPVFHVSMLRRYVPNESHLIQYDAVDLDDSLRYIEEPVAILARDVRRLRSRAIPVVKVHWRHLPVEEATWETEHEMRAQFPGLFEHSGTS
ncbi:hypothetical protein MTR67_031414 [Solanum verrucosum]|uniref:Uncharacterized protein n=1 Tax=Solanum verrucosum TaxID=315347 RepID=A0AAF0ZHK6_SOLVR|nr:hypothetical protein MTR67_031414 [Solanum verrucosum]